MASVKKITMREYNGTDYDTLYPKTIASQVDGVYNKTEVDTLLANKPSKSPVHVDDANDVTKSGFYTCKTNIPFGYEFANVLAVGDIDDPNNIFTQIAFGVNLNPVNRNAIAVRCYVPGEGFKDWEWFNPPMTLGVEYRTTERYQGKPVYALAFDFGELPNTSRKIKYAPVAANVDEIIACGGCGVGYSLPSFYPASSYNSFTVDDIKLSAGLSTNGGIACAIGTGKNFSSQKATVWVKYTKTTD